MAHPDPGPDGAPPPGPDAPGGAGFLGRFVVVEPGEVRALLLSFAYNFFLFASYYILQPLRDEMGIVGGTRNLPWLFMASLVAMVVANAAFGWVASALPRRRFIPLVYRASMLALGGFWLAMTTATPGDLPVVARAFFLFVGVFNLFIVSVFWAFMADVWTSAQGKRLFGFVGAGGTLGQLGGSSVTATLAGAIGPVNLLLVSIVGLEVAVRCAGALAARLASPAPEDPFPDAPSPGDAPAEEGGLAGAMAGARLVLASPYLLGICAYLFLYTFTSTFLWFAKISIVKAAFTDSAMRTAFFGKVNLVVGVVTVLVQLFLTGRILTRIGVAATLALVPGVTAVGFVGLGLAPTLVIYVGVEVVRKSVNYSLARPARELLYTVVTRDEKYKAKALIDTFVYRAGDGIAAAVFAAFQKLAFGLQGICFTAVPVALAFMATGVALGRAQRKRAEAAAPAAPPG